MRPYITVVLDSFHEAFASRVLYLLLLVMTLVLAGMAPIGYSEQRSVKLHPRDIHDWPALIKALRKQAAGETASPGKRIAELAPEALANFIKEPSDNNELTFVQVNEIVEGLNALLPNKSLYDEKSWDGIRLRDSTQKLLSQGVDNLSQDDVEYFNRLLLRDSYPANFGVVGDKELFVTYAWWSLPEPVPGGKTWFPQIVKVSLAAFMDLFVGMLAIFVAVLVTAPIIPRTFEPGAIDLLLSKPISRSLLIIAKYLGGCAFILLSAGYFIIGLWLIIGLRLGVWSDKLPLCIPIFMFQFAIYYAVSMLAGVIWRNAIVCIVVTVLFFMSCFTVGTTKIAIEQFLTPHQLDRMIPVNNGLIGVTKLGHFVEWNEKQQTWDETLQGSDRRKGRPMGPMMPTKIVGPIYQQSSQSLIYIKQPPAGPPFRFLGSGSEFMTAKWSGNWKADVGPTPPAGTSWIFQDSQENTLLVSSTGVFQYMATDGPKKSAPKIFGFELPVKAGDDPFVKVGPEDFSFGVPYSAAIDHESNRLLIDTEESLLLLSRTGEKVQYTVQASVKHETQGPTQTGLTRHWAIVVSKDGQIRFLNSSDLTNQPNSLSFRPAGDSPPAAVETSEDGNYTAVLFQNGRLWVHDENSHKGLIIERNATAVAFQKNQLLIADVTRKVRECDPTTGSTTKTYAPTMETLSWYYYWVIQPIYTVFPKPGELSNVIKSMLVEDIMTSPEDQGSEEVKMNRRMRDTTEPLVHGTIFVLLMLVVTCAYVERLDL